ncbi:hypothetical protein [Pedobacter frigoris]|uniref:hypothetical protein n=1 Tax=Pedobacter frigoris TaxID=2571272 RepID=UPI00292D0335|nr:hypothetical protein [Pedobacter frigoris]
MFNNPFSFEGRIRRLEYGLSNVVYMLVLFGVVGLLMAFGDSHKAVLDALKGIIFENNSQVVRLLALKDTHPFDANGLSIGINKFEEQSKG